MSYTTTTISLWSLLDQVGISPADSQCLLDDEQCLRLGRVLLGVLPPDDGSHLLVGGALAPLLADQGLHQVEALPAIGEGALLLTTGSAVAVALLARQEGALYRARIWSDPDSVDRITLVLSQLVDIEYQFDTRYDLIRQRELIDVLVAALRSDPVLRGQAYAGLLPGHLDGPAPPEEVVLPPPAPQLGLAQTVAAEATPLPESVAASLVELPALVEPPKYDAAWLTARRNANGIFSSVVALVRPPVATIRDTLMQLPSLGSLNDQQRALLSQGLLRSNELALLLNDLWAITQIALQPTEQYEAVRLPTLIEAAIAMQHYEFDRRGQQLVSAIGDQFACVFGDQELLGRALLALLDNAAKYTPSGAQVTVALTQEHDYVQVAVQNANVSLLPDELERIFDPCYRAPSTAHLGIPGRGLGLSIARAVVERHGGQIWALNPDGQSTMVVFRMPCEIIGPL